MSVISTTDALEKLAKAVEETPTDSLADVYTELFPERAAPELTGTNAQVVRENLTRSIRAGLEPEAIVELWNVVFPTDRYVHYDEEERLIRYNEEEPWYARP